MLKSSAGTSTGRVCDGFEATASQIVQTPPVTQPLKSQASSIEIRSIEFFIEKSRTQFAALFQDEWWNTQILQLAYAETSIRHALVALSMHHEKFISKKSGVELQFATRQQNLAIRELLHSNQQSLTHLHPMTCFIFICIEVRLLNLKAFQSANRHFRSYKETMKPRYISLSTVAKCFGNCKSKEHAGLLYMNLISAPLCGIWRHHSID
jgi:hypothetical protein